MEQYIFDLIISVFSSQWTSFFCAPLLFALALVHSVTFQLAALIIPLFPLTFHQPVLISPAREIELNIDESVKTKGSRFLHLSAKKLAALLRSGDVTSCELVEVTAPIPAHVRLRSPKLPH
jgi:hypothetical protein